MGVSKGFAGLMGFTGTETALRRTFPWTCSSRHLVLPCLSEGDWESA